MRKPIFRLPSWLSRKPKAQPESPAILVGDWKTAPEKGIIAKSDPITELAQVVPITRADWVDSLPEPCRSYAYRNAEQHKWSPEFWREPLNSMLSALGGCFHWDSSPEGSEYWFQVERGNYAKAADILRVRGIKPQTSADLDFIHELGHTVSTADKIRLCLSYYSGLSYIQIAEKTGLDPKKVSSHLGYMKTTGEVDRKLKAILDKGKWYASWFLTKSV